jgi:hypothetical protein
MGWILQEVTDGASCDETMTGAARSRSTPRDVAHGPGGDAYSMVEQGLETPLLFAAKVFDTSSSSKRRSPACGCSGVLFWAEHFSLIS